MQRFLLLLLLLVVGPPAVGAQDVEGFFDAINARLASGDVLRISGRAGLRGGLSSFSDGGSGAARRAAPYTWGVTAGLNFDLLGIQAPFSLALSGRNTLYNLPSYSFYGLSPTYRWITLHAGDRSLSFSPYSLSGINFRGAGFELRPGKFYVAGMSGRLRRARIQDAGSIQDLETRFRRRGHGLKAGYDNGTGTAAAVSLFSSADEATEPPRAEDTLLLATPERNLVLTLGAAHRFGKLLSIEGEWAQSVLTRDERAAYLSDPAGAVRLFGLFRPRTTTTASRALRLRVGFSPAFGKVDLQYERIAPEYRTHGSLYFQNDVEHLTTSLSAPLFAKRLTLAARFGVQRNDLDGRRASNRHRLLGAVNLAYAFSDRINSTLGLSNISSTNRYKSLSLENTFRDSIVLAQTQFGLTTSTTFLLDAKRGEVLLLSGSWQRAGLIRNERVDTSQLNQFGLLMASFAHQPEGGRQNFTASIVGHANVTPLYTLLTVGPALAYGRQILGERGRLSASANYSLVFDNLSGGGGGGDVLQLQAGGSYALTKKQRFNLAASLLRAGPGTVRPGYTNLQISAGYGLSF